MMRAYITTLCVVTCLAAFACLLVLAIAGSAPFWVNLSAITTAVSAIGIVVAMPPW